MSEKSEKKTGKGEKALRFLRDFNIFVGGAALVSTVIAPPVAAAALTAYGAFNLAQAGGYEALRQGVKKRGKRRSKG